MEQFAPFIVAFMFGMFVGAGLFIVYGLYMVDKMKKAKLNLVDDVKKQVGDSETRVESIKKRLLKASELAQTQLALRAQIDMPSKNALHSRHKNGLIFEINDLEQQKISILKSILGDGFDPTITVINEGGTREEIPLSAYVAHAEQTLNNSGLQADPNNGSTPTTDTKKVGKFIVYKGGKDDDGTTH